MPDRRGSVAGPRAGFLPGCAFCLSAFSHVSGIPCVRHLCSVPAHQVCRQRRREEGSTASMSQQYLSSLEMANDVLRLYAGWGASRVKSEALERFVAALRQAEVPGTGWDTAAETRGAEADVDALIAEATQRKARPRAPQTGQLSCLETRHMSAVCLNRVWGVVLHGVRVRSGASLRHGLAHLYAPPVSAAKAWCLL